MSHPYERLFEPTSIGSMTLKNRFAMAPMGPLGLSDALGGWNSRGIDYYVARARGGTGLIITGVTPVPNPAEPFAPGNVPCALGNPTDFLRTSREMVERVHAYDSRIMLQLTAGFGRVIMNQFLSPGMDPVAPSAIPHRWSERTCREMTVGEIQAIVQAMAASAKVAQMAGFDAVQIHAVHEGYLLDQFAIAMFNRRTDDYGGSLANRLRFAREIVQAIKAGCGQDFPVTLRYSAKSFVKDWRVGALPGEEFEEMGRDLPEGIEAARLLTEYGYDALDVDAGTYDSWYWNHPPMYQAKGLYVPMAKAVREAVEVPVICAGRMDDPDLALAALEDGALDVVSLGRPLLADPDYVNKLWTGRRNLIRPCLSCQEGCMGRIGRYAHLSCAVNAQCGREREWALTPSPNPKRVLIVGGGVAGCEAARVLRIRGHCPVLVEASDRLGGKLLPGGAPSFKQDDHALADWYAATLADLDVDVRLGATITPERVREAVDSGDVQEVIVATGSQPVPLDLGGDLPVHTAADVLDGTADPGEQTVIVGGGLVGCELALHLVESGVKVAIVEAGPDILAVSGPLCEANHEMLHDLVHFKGVQCHTSARALKSTTTGLTIAEGETEVEVPASSVILAVGYTPERALYEAVRDVPVPVHVLGDARRVANIMYAVWDAFELASGI